MTNILKFYEYGYCQSVKMLETRRLQVTFRNFRKWDFGRGGG